MCLFMQYLFNLQCILHFLSFVNVQGSISFGAGFFLIVIGWPIVGMILEAYGFIILFRYAKPNKHCFTEILLFSFAGVADGDFRSGFWPTLSVFVQKIPILGWIFRQPLLRSVCISCSSIYCLMSVAL